MGVARRRELWWVELVGEWGGEGFDVEKDTDRRAAVEPDLEATVGVSEDACPSTAQCERRKNDVLHDGSDVVR